MLGDALVFPTARPGWQKTVGAGGLLLAVLRLGSVGVYRFVSWGRSIAPDSVTVAVGLATVGMVLSGIVLAGYHARVLRSGITGGSVLPSFRPLGGLFATGVGICVVVLVYGLGTVVIVGVVGLLAGGALRSPIERLSGTTAESLSLVEPAGGLTVALTVVVLLYVSVAATARFAHDDRVRSAFAIRSILGVAFTSEFFVGFVLWSGIVLVLGVLGVTLVSVVVGLFLVFYATVAGTYALGRGYGKVANRNTEPSINR